MENESRNGEKPAAESTEPMSGKSPPKGELGMHPVDFIAALVHMQRLRNPQDLEGCMVRVLESVYCQLERCDALFNAIDSHSHRSDEEYQEIYHQLESLLPSPESREKLIELDSAAHDRQAEQENVEFKFGLIVGLSWGYVDTDTIKHQLHRWFDRDGTSS